MTSYESEDEAELAALLSGELPLDSAEGQAALHRSGLARSAFNDLKAIADELDFRSVVEEAELMEDAPGSKDVVETLHRAAQGIDRNAALQASNRERPSAILWFGAVLAAAAALLLVIALGGEESDEGGSTLTGRTLGGPTNSKAALVIQQGRLVIPYSLELGDAMDIVIEGRVGANTWESRIQTKIRAPELALSGSQLDDLRRYEELRLNGTLDAADGSRPALFAQPLAVQFPR